MRFGRAASATVPNRREAADDGFPRAETAREVGAMGDLWKLVLVMLQVAALFAAGLAIARHALAA